MRKRRAWPRTFRAACSSGRRWWASGRSEDGARGLGRRAWPGPHGGGRAGEGAGEGPARAAGAHMHGGGPQGGLFPRAGLASPRPPAPCLTGGCGHGATSKLRALSWLSSELTCPLSATMSHCIRCVVGTTATGAWPQGQRAGNATCDLGS